MCLKNWLCSCIAAALLIASSVIASPSELTVQVDRQHGGEFTLNSPRGPVSLNRYRDQVVLIFFGFTSCPDVCPIALSVISSAFRQLQPEERQQVKALFISLDPDRDTLDVLEKYTGYFHPNIVGATDRIEAVTRLATNYGIRFEKIAMVSSPIGYVINHPPDILVVNQRGELLESRIKPEHGADEIVAFVRNLLASSD